MPGAFGRNRKANKSARGLFALGAFAEGLQKGMEQRDALAMKLAENELRKRQVETDDYFKARGAQQDLYKMTQPTQVWETGANGQPSPKTIPPLLSKEDYLAQEGELRKRYSTLPPMVGTPGPKAGNEPTRPGSKTVGQVSPESQLSSLDYLQGLLNKIPTNVGTLGTVGAAKVLGGEREIMGVKIGSDAAKEYEDAKPGAAVSVYRAMTGDTRLSDADAQARALPFLPSTFPVMDTTNVRSGKMSRIRKAFELAAQEKARNPQLAEQIANDETGQTGAAFFDSIMKKVGTTVDPSSNSNPIANPESVNREIQRGDRVRVRRKADGKPGTILRKDYDPVKYEVVQ